MPMGAEGPWGTEKDGSKSEYYCEYCYKDGEFVQPNMTMEEMIDFCVPFMTKDTQMDEKTARGMLNEAMPKLKRWSK